MKKSGVTGDRFKEAVSINSGLLALSQVIKALAEKDKKSNIHIPYRDSKLTRILTDSLGGNSITIMIACISPSMLNVEETQSTLNYASFAKSIKLKPSVNKETDSLEREQLVKQNIELENELRKYKESGVY